MKKTNKGFSLVELIIVIAIMAILAGAIAPALIRYIDKSRKSNDVSSAKTFKTAVETAMSKEVTYELLTTDSAATLADGAVADGKGWDYTGCLYATAGTTIDDTGAAVTMVKPASNILSAEAPTADADMKKEVSKNIGEKVPKVKYKKDAVSASDGTSFIAGSSCNWYAYITGGGSVITGLGDASHFYQLAPEVSKYYQ